MIAKIFPVAIRKNRGWFMVFGEYCANIGKRRTILPTCQRTRRPFFGFSLLLRCSLTCSGTSALTSQLTVTQFLYHTEQRRGSSAVPKCSEEDESWLGANWKQVRAGVTSFSYFPTLWQMFLMAPWLVWFAVLAGALILFPPLIRQQGGWKFPPARLHFVRKLNCMIDTDFL